MPRKFIVDFGEVDVVDVPREVREGYLPYFILDGREESRDFATAYAKERYKENPNIKMWIARVAVVGVPMKDPQWVVQKPGVFNYEPMWSMLTNDEKIAQGWDGNNWYAIVDDDNVPTKVGTVFEFHDSQGRPGVMQLRSDLEPAPWWEDTDRLYLVSSVASLLDILTPRELNLIILWMRPLHYQPPVPNHDPHTEDAVNHLLAVMGNPKIVPMDQLMRLKDKITAVYEGNYEEGGDRAEGIEREPNEEVIRLKNVIGNDINMGRLTLRGLRGLYHILDEQCTNFELDPLLAEDDVANIEMAILHAITFRIGNDAQYVDCLTRAVQWIEHQIVGNP